MSGVSDCEHTSPTSDAIIRSNYPARISCKVLVTGLGKNVLKDLKTPISNGCRIWVVWAGKHNK